MTDIRRKLKVHHKDVTIDGEVMYLSETACRQCPQKGSTQARPVI